MSRVLSGPDLHTGNFRLLLWGCLSGIWRSSVLLNDRGSQRFRRVWSLLISDHDATLAVDCVVILTKITWREHGSLFDVLFRGSGHLRLFYLLWRGSNNDCSVSGLKSLEEGLTSSSYTKVSSNGGFSFTGLGRGRGAVKLAKGSRVEVGSDVAEAGSVDTVSSCWVTATSEVVTSGVVNAASVSLA